MDSKEHAILGIEGKQWRNIKFFIGLILFAEIVMLLMNKYVFEIYIVFSAFLFSGFILKVLKLYRKNNIPLKVDLLAIGISLLFVLLSYFLKASPARFLLILCSSAIIMPYFRCIMSAKQ